MRELWRVSCLRVRRGIRGSLYRASGAWRLHPRGRAGTRNGATIRRSAASRLSRGRVRLGLPASRS